MVKDNNVISKGSAKVFRYNAGVDAIVDGNTVSMAFLREYRAKNDEGTNERKTLMEYTWYTKDNGNLIKRGLKVSGHGEYGVPTLKEYDVYIALQRIFISKKTNNGICELPQITNELGEDVLTINFTINELCKELGYKTPGAKTRENIKKSIDTLLATTLFSMHEGGIYDINKKKYISNTKVAIHLLESMISVDMIGDDGVEDMNYTRLKLSRFTYDQILNDYKLFYDKDIYNKTKNLMAKKIYHMALQWKGSNNFSYANIDTIIERIPMIDMEHRYKKRDIKKALRELDDKGIVKIKYDDKNADKVYFMFDCEQNTCVMKHNNYSEMKEKFYSIGFNIVETEELLDIQNIRYIQALLRYIDTKNNIKNLKNYFKKCLKDNIKVDGMYYDKV